MLWLFLLSTTYSELCISAGRLTIGSIKLSPPPEESLRDRGLVPCGVHEDSLSKSLSFASSTPTFSRRIWVRLFFKVSSYLHSSLLFIELHWLQTGWVPVHFCKSEININRNAGRECHWLVYASYSWDWQGKLREMRRTTDSPTRETGRTAP